MNREKYLKASLRTYNVYYRVTGEKAEQLLTDYGQDGDFLARYSESSPTHYSISIRKESRLIHIKIQRVDDLLSVFDGSNSACVFPSLVELLEYYINNPTKLIERNGGYVTLKSPLYIPYEKEYCAKEQRLVQMNRWFHGNITATEAMEALEGLKIGSFLVRFSQHLPGALVITAKAETGPVHLTIHQNPLSGRYTMDGDNFEYDDIQELLRTYSKNPIVEKRQSKVVYLEYPITTTSTFVPADILADRFEMLKEFVDNTGKSSKTGIAEEFERLQAEVAPAEQFFSKREGRREINVSKNRYKNIVPFDHTRIILKDKPGVVGSDYINASIVRFDAAEPPLTLAPCRNYIATQGCMESTMGAFWRMVWQENSRIIVMPTRENERREKCARYWPELDKSVTHDDITITTTSEQAVAKDLPDEMIGLVEDHRDEVSYIIRTFTIKKANAVASRIVRHLQYVSWPDHGCPFHPHEVITFLETVDHEHKSFGKAEVDQGPVVVHCSAGIGRTGTFMLLDVLLNQIKVRGRGAPIDVWRTTRYARDWRGGLVQTEQQYQFLYTAVTYYMRKHNPNPDQRLYVRDSSSRHHGSGDVSPPPPGVLRVPDVAVAYIGPSGPNSSPRYESDPIARQRARTSPKASTSSSSASSSNPPLPTKASSSKK